MMQSTEISVVIVTCNQVNRLLDTLWNLQALPENTPLLVVDNGSTDGTPERVHAEFPAVTVLSLPPGLGCVSRNKGIRLAKTPLIAIEGEERLFSADMRSKGWSLAYAGDMVAYHFPSSIRSLSRRIDLLTRDILWYYWLRRPWYYALRHTLHIHQKSRFDAHVRSGYQEARRQIHRILLNRQPVPPAVEEQLLRIEQFY